MAISAENGIEDYMV